MALIRITRYDHMSKHEISLTCQKVNQKDKPIYLQLVTGTKIDTSCIDFFLFPK